MLSRTLTQPNGTKPPGCPAWWPFGTVKPADNLPPVVRMPMPKQPISDLPDALF